MMKNIRVIAHERYKLDWMLQHGYTLDDLIRSVNECMEDGGCDLMDVFNIWEEESGFNGEIWACYDEFIDNEYENEEYMKALLDEYDFADYCLDHDKCVCQWCGEVTDFTDDDGRTEVQIGWMCHQCIAAVKSRGEELEFIDEEIG